MPDEQAPGGKDYYHRCKRGVRFCAGESQPTFNKPVSAESRIPVPPLGIGRRRQQPYNQAMLQAFVIAVCQPFDEIFASPGVVWRVAPYSLKRMPGQRERIIFFGKVDGALGVFVACRRIQHKMKFPVEFIEKVLRGVEFFLVI